MRTGTRKVVYYCNCQISRESLHTVLHYKYVRYYCTHDNKTGLKRSGIKREKEKKPTAALFTTPYFTYFPLLHTHPILDSFHFFFVGPVFFFSRMWETVFCLIRSVRSFVTWHHSFPCNGCLGNSGDDN